METDEQSEARMKKFLQRHWKMTIVMAVYLVVAIIVAFLVFLKVAVDAQILGFVPVTLGLWTVGIVFIFCITVIIWELAFVASWAIPIAVITIFLWYRKLPEEERKEYEGPRRGAETGGSGGFSGFVSLIWLVIVWFTGRWNLTFQTWPLNDWIFTWIAAFLWALLPVCIGGLVYLGWVMLKDKKEES